ncbi:MAG: aminotransferase class V-fold PLP-dependent enzyme [Pseudomonadota bacterium]
MDERYQSLFVPAEGIYLLNHSIGRPLRNVREAWSTAFLRPWESEGEATWPHWLHAIDRFRSALSQLLNSPAAQFCPQDNLSSALNKVLSCFEPTEHKHTLVFSEHDFPSMAYVLQQAQRRGFGLKMLPADMDVLSPAVWSDFLTQDVAAALVTHVHSNTGLKTPVAEICALAATKGIVSIVDVAQSAGVVPIDLSQWQADFVIGSCVKWLCGGPGAGYLWIAGHRLPSSEPTDVGWFSHEDPFEFDINSFRYAEDALRFWGGTPSVAPFVVATNAVEQLCDIGIDTIRLHNLRLTDRLIEQRSSEHVATPLDHDSRGGTVVLRFPSDQLAVVRNQLTEARVAFDVRPTGIRLSPHIYNDLQEIETVVAALTI